MTAVSKWDLGSPYRNVCAVLGDNPLYWFVPIHPDNMGNGHVFPVPRLAPAAEAAETAAAVGAPSVLAGAGTSSHVRGGVSATAASASRGHGTLQRETLVVDDGDRDVPDSDSIEMGLLSRTHTAGRR
jgi:hypothetical protein